MSSPAEQAVFHPGAYLRELLHWQSISPEEFADRTGIPVADMIDITQAKRAISNGISEVLAAHFGNASQFWLELQDLYDRTSRDAAESAGTASAAASHAGRR